MNKTETEILNTICEVISANNFYEALSAIGMLIIAGIVAWITLMQYSVNREKHRFELYEKRFSIYKELKSFILNVILTEDFLTSDENLKIIYRMADEADFLFGEDIVKCINTIKEKAHSIYKKSNELNIGTMEISQEDYKKIELKPLSEGDAAKVKQDLEELELWFDIQLENLPKEFSKYMKFEIEKNETLAKLLNIISCKSKKRK